MALILRGKPRPSTMYCEPRPNFRSMRLSVFSSVSLLVVPVPGVMKAPVLGRTPGSMAALCSISSRVSLCSRVGPILGSS